MEHTFAVIMAGGVGSRFWPRSRAKTPKQLLDLTGSGQTMLAATVARLTPEIPLERVLVVTGEITADEVAACLPGLPRANILAEPEGRNTAPCIGWAALHVRARDPQGVMAVMPSDHLVSDVAGFKRYTAKAVAAAAGGALVTFGIVPDGPETGFGYIEMGAAVGEGVNQAVRFVEKPDLPTAKKYVAAGNFAWNSGMFFFKANRILEELAAQMPTLYAGLLKIDQAIGQAQEATVLATVFPSLPAESIDYGVMERASNILCIPVSFGWSDLGSWAAAYDYSDKDEAGNVTTNQTIAVDANGCLVQSSSAKVIALVGVDDLVVVDTDDALLICKRDRAQDVKKVVGALKKSDRKDLL